MNKGNEYIKLGLLLNVMGILVKYLYLLSITLPDFLKGFLEGFFISLGLVLILFGFYCESSNIAICINLKKKIFNNILRK